MSKTLILYDCLGSQAIDSEALPKATGMACSRVHTALCAAQAPQAAEAIAAGEVIICCGQETSFFEALADEADGPAPAFFDLRDRAGWSADAASTIPEMSALVAEACLPRPTGKAVDVLSEGVCLILGAGEAARMAAESLQDHPAVTMLMPDPPEGPVSRKYDIVIGRLRRAQRALGQFEVTIDGLRQAVRGGRGDLAFNEPQNGGRSHCDIILDLRGDAPLFPAPEKREGYLRVDPGSPSAVAAAILEALHLVGTLEKPLYVRAEPHL